MEIHQVKVAELKARLISRPKDQEVSLVKETPTHTVHSRAYKKDKFPVDVSPLNQILSIDTERMTITAEGQVTMGDLAKVLLPKYSLLVTPEYEDFTIAGLIAGQGLFSCCLVSII
jgi:hypothetical protein